MSVDHTFVTTIGLVIPIEFVFRTVFRTETLSVQPYNCGHHNDASARFCSQCGNCLTKYTYSVLLFTEGPYGDVDTLHNGWAAPGMPDGVKITLHEDMMGLRVLIAGWTLSRMADNNIDTMHRHTELPAFDRAALESALTAAKIPFLPDTWGVHALALAN